MRQESLDKITVDLRADIDLPPVAQVDKSTRSIYENSDMTPTLSSHFIWELQDNRVVKNLKFFTLNLEVMSKFYYIERGLFQSYNSPYFATPGPESFLTEMQCFFFVLPPWVYLNVP